jgi:hypothetical protein
VIGLLSPRYRHCAPPEREVAREEQQSSVGFEVFRFAYLTTVLEPECAERRLIQCPRIALRIGYFCDPSSHVSTPP